MMKFGSLAMPKKEEMGPDGEGAEIEIEMEPKEGEMEEEGSEGMDLSALSDEELLKEVKARGLKITA